MLAKIKYFIKHMSYPKFEGCSITWVGSKCPKISVGKYSYMRNTTIYCWDSSIQIQIGKFCSFADKVQIVGGRA